jgi:hypothetical protein
MKVPRKLEVNPAMAVFFDIMLRAQVPLFGTA